MARLGELLAQKARVEKALEKEMAKLRAVQAKAIEQIIKLARRAELGIDELTGVLETRLGGGTPAVKESLGRPKQRPSVGQPMYRDPTSGSTWTGRGKPPQWIPKNKEKRIAFLISPVSKASGEGHDGSSNGRGLLGGAKPSGRKAAVKKVAATAKKVVSATKKVAVQRTAAQASSKGQRVAKRKSRAAAPVEKTVVKRVAKRSLSVPPGERSGAAKRAKKQVAAANATGVQAIESSAPEQVGG